MGRIHTYSWAVQTIDLTSWDAANTASLLSGLPQLSWKEWPRGGGEEDQLWAWSQLHPTSFVTGNKEQKKRLLSFIARATNLRLIGRVTINRRGFIYCLALEISQQQSTPACSNNGRHPVFVNDSVWLCLFLCQTAQPGRAGWQCWMLERSHWEMAMEKKKGIEKTCEKRPVPRQAEEWSEVSFQWTWNKQTVLGWQAFHEGSSTPSIKSLLGGQAT